jgi:galactokinase
MTNLTKNITNHFKKHFSGKPKLIRSPGRVNLIGDHTDYNDGFVLPAAIDRAIYIAIAPNRDQQIHAIALDMPQSRFKEDISGELEPVDVGWANYLLGSVDQLRKRGFYVPGFDCVIGGNIPIGAGLSSSAALEGGVIFALNEIGGYGLSRFEIAKMGQQVEHSFAGVQCGIMDQFANLHGKENQLMKLDCRSLTFEWIPFFDDDVRILLCDTKVHRELAGSEYNVRRSQCEEGVRILAQAEPSVKSLRDVTVDLLEENKKKLSPVVYKRCRYVLNENERVLQACYDLEHGDLEAFGRKMVLSHEGLRDEYEVSCRELDFLVDLAISLEGVLGSRMMGGGFGGCTINLVKKEAADQVTGHLFDTYLEETGIKPDIHVVKTADGTGFIEKEA